MRRLGNGSFTPFQQGDSSLQDAFGLVCRNTMTKNHFHDLFNDGILSF